MDEQAISDRLAVSGADQWCVWVYLAQCQLSWRTLPVAEIPYLRRDRFWVRQPLQDVGNFLIQIGDLYTDSNYNVELSTFTIRNGALALVATKFDS